MKINKIGFLLAGLVFLPGCMRVPTYHRKPLKSVSDSFTYYGAEKNVIVQAKRLTEDNIQYLFGIRRNQQEDNSFAVIYLSVHNLSGISYLLSSADIDFAMLSYQEVVQCMKTSSAIRLAGGVLSISATAYPSIYFFTFGAFMRCAIACYAGLSLGIVGIGLGLTYLGVGIKSLVMNGRIEKDLKEKMLHKKVIIKSGDHYEGLIFVKSSDYKPQFDLVISQHDKRDNKNIFKIDLEQE